MKRLVSQNMWDLLNSSADHRFSDGSRSYKSDQSEAMLRAAPEGAWLHMQELSWEVDEDGWKLVIFSADDGPEGYIVVTIDKSGSVSVTRKVIDRIETKALLMYEEQG